MDAEVAFASVANRRPIWFSRPLLAVFKSRTGFVGHLFGRAVRVSFSEVESSGIIGTRHYAVSATYANVIVDDNYSVGTFPGGRNWAHGPAWRIVALHAWTRNKSTSYVRILAYSLLHNRSVDYTRGENVLAVAANRASVASYALPQIDDHHPAALLHWFLQSLLEFSLHPQKRAFSLTNRQLLKFLTHQRRAFKRTNLSRKIFLAQKELSCGERADRYAGSFEEFPTFRLNSFFFRHCAST